MAEIILVTGGVRSGKSARAEAVALELCEYAPAGQSRRPVYIATNEFFDGEMSARIAAHRARRGDHWDLVEAPIDLAQALSRTDGSGARLVDCLTIWLGNLLHHGHDWAAAAEDLLRALAVQQSPVVLVSSEVGLGITPDNALARAFCDVAGTVNQRVAHMASAVEFVVAGLPLKLKG